MSNYSVEIENFAGKTKSQRTKLHRDLTGLDQDLSPSLSQKKQQNPNIKIVSRLDRLKIVARIRVWEPH